jgi:L-2-hydroxycarboxylate dehydrogenase (NAD+)
LIPLSCRWKSGFYTIYAYPMRQATEIIRNTLQTILVAHGVPERLARIQTDLLMEAQMRGYASHGLLRLPRIVERIVNGVSSPTARGAHEWVSDSFLHVDGQCGLGPVVAVSALDALKERVRRSGIALAAIRNSNHIGMLAWYGDYVARDGLILIAATTSEALVHPWGGRRALIGTNPLCIAVPGTPEPLVLDMATSLVSMGKIHDHANRGVPISEGWALDAEGNPTTDAAAAKSGAIAPFGGAKGYALGLALELLVTSLAGSAIGPAVHGTLDSNTVCNKGDLFIVISPPQSASTAAAIHAYLDEIRASGSGRPGSDQRHVSVPGDRSREARARSIATGVEVDDALWQQILALAPSFDRKVSKLI